MIENLNLVSFPSPFLINQTHHHRYRIFSATKKTVQLTIFLRAIYSNTLCAQDIQQKPIIELTRANSESKPQVQNQTKLR